MIVASPNPSRMGVGLYSYPEAARLLGVPVSTLKHWCGYSRPSLVSLRFPQAEHTISFAELMELRFIRMFREHGVSLQTIRRASKTAARQFQTDYPFIARKFDTDGHTIFATLKSRTSDQTIIQDLAKGQLVFTKIVKPFFKRLEYSRGDELVRFWPMQKSGRVVLDPARRFGKPMIADTGITTETIVSAVKAGQDAEDVARWLEIPLAAVKAAIRFEHSPSQ